MRVIKGGRLFIKANLLMNEALWAYIDCYKEEYKKPNQVDKRRNRAIRKQCYKRAKKELES